MILTPTCYLHMYVIYTYMLFTPVCYSGTVRQMLTLILGVFTDDDLNWEHHINTVISKLLKVAEIVYKIN